MVKPDKQDTPVQKIRALRDRAREIANNPTYGSPQELAAVTVELATALEEMASVIQPDPGPEPNPAPADVDPPFPPLRGERRHH